jgi:glycosyltransferase involved in cell wall biosynthesis
MTELVSILLATRNRRRQLERALNSMLAQSHSALEILIMDDASTDETPRFLDRTASNEPRLRWFRREQPQGLASALNELIAQSRGTWLARMDDDDLAYPSRIEQQLAFMRAHNLDVCGTWYRRVAGWRKSIARPPVSHERILDELLFQPPLLHPSVMFHRSVFERYGVYSLTAPHAEDYELWVRLMPNVRFGNCPEVLLDYTLSDEQVSRQHNPEQVATAQELRIKALDQLGIPHTAEQARIHAHLRDPKAITTPAELGGIHDWLCTLSKRLEPSTRPAVQRQWFLQCVRAASLGPTTFRAYNGSPLAENNRKKKAMLWVLCQLRLRYRSPLYNQLEPLAGID